MRACLPRSVRRSPALGASQDLLPVAKSDLAKSLDGDLGVDVRRIGRAVTDVVADRLEWEVRVDESLDAGVAQRVRARSGHVDSRTMQVVRDTSRDSTGGERALRREHAQEDPPLARFGTTVLQVVQQRRTDGRGQGIAGAVTRLALGDPDPL